ncbi:hypothetical protein MAR_037871, partial [Mya arenaria]
MGLMIDIMTDADMQWGINVHFVRSGSPKTSDWGTFPGQTALLTDNTTVTTGYHTAQGLVWLWNGVFSYSWINWIAPETKPRVLTPSDPLNVLAVVAFISGFQKHRSPGADNGTKQLNGKLSSSLHDPRMFTHQRYVISS